MPTASARRFLLGWLALALAVTVTGLSLSKGYYFSVLNMTAINVIAVTGLNLLIGYAGQVSIGHAAFLALGAYGSGLCAALTGLSPWLSAPLAACGSGLVAALIGIPTLRLTGNYLVMATLGFNIIVELLLIQWDGLTGGSSGFTGIPGFSLGSLSLGSDARFYWLVWALALGLLWPARNLIQSPVGRALRALHDSENAAKVCGVPVESFKVRVFVVSAMYASLAGSLQAHYLGIVTPKSYDIFLSVELVTMCLVGGVGSLWGGVFGAAFLTPLPQLLQVFEEHHDIIFGGVLLVLLIFMPQGIFGKLEDWRVRRAAARMRRLDTGGAS